MTFKYRLLPLLKKDRFEGEALGQEARTACKVLEEKVRLCEQAYDTIRKTEAAMRELYQQEQSIQLGRREVLQTFLRYQQGVAQAREKEASKAHALYEEILGRLRSKRVSIRTLEKHEDRKRREHAYATRRADAKQADEAWLHRRGSDT